jgi:hypothetical protein
LDIGLECSRPREITYLDGSADSNEMVQAKQASHLEVVLHG